MNIGSIVNGHLKEILGKEEELSNKRLKICDSCPLYFYTNKTIGPICNSFIYYNPVIKQTATKYKEGFIKGCGCRLNAKTRVKNENCPLDRWSKIK